MSSSRFSAAYDMLSVERKPTSAAKAGLIGAGCGTTEVVPFPKLRSSQSCARRRGALPKVRLRLRALPKLRPRQGRSFPLLRRLRLSHALREHFRIQIREERLVQALHYVGDDVLLDHERQVDLRSPLRNHADFDVRQFTKDPSRYAGGIPQILARPGRQWLCVLHTSRPRVWPGRRPG